MRISVIVTATLMILIGIILFFYGTSYMSNPRNALNGSYITIFGVFLAIAGFLMLVSHVFRGRSMFY